MKERPLFLMAVSCVLGEVLAVFSKEMNFALVVLPALGLQSVFAAAFFAKKRGRKLLITWCFLLTGFWSGLLGYRSCCAEYVQELSAYEGKTVLLSGTVTYAEERESGVYYYLKDVTVYDGEAAEEKAADRETAEGDTEDPPSEEEGTAPEKIAAYRKSLVIDYRADVYAASEDDGAQGELSGKDSAYYVGKKVTLTAAYSPMNEAANPGNYDEADYYESKGIGLKVTLEAWQTAEGGNLSVANLLYRVRSALHGRICALTDEKTAALYCGMLLGEGYEISSDDKDIFRTGGIGHILAISGLHISLIGMGVYRILRLRFREGTATAAGIVFLLLYGGLTGQSPSTLRAIAMFSLRILAKKCGRRFDFLSAAGFAAWTILLAEPAYLFYSGFQLSFCAVFGAALAAPMVQKYLRTAGALKNAFLSGVTVQSFLLPVQLYYFYQIAPYGILINLLVLPSMGLVLLAGILGTGIGCVWAQGGGALLAAGGKLLDFYAWLCRQTLALPGGLWITGAPSAVRILLFYGILAILPALMFLEKKRDEKKNGRETQRLHLLNVRALDMRVLFPWFRGRERRGRKISEEKQLGPRMTFAKRLRRLCLCILALTAALLVLTGKSRPKLKTVFLDVGQGNGIFLESAAGTTWLVDGGSSSISEVGTYRILPYLKWAGVSKIDYMVLTHVDSDHYSGLLEILEQARTGVRVGCLLVPDMADLDENYAVVLQTATENEVPVFRLLTGVSWEEDELRIECIWPDKDADFTDTNEGSGVLSVTCGDFSMLLTGDIGEETEAYLTEHVLLRENIRGITVLGVPHHGSAYSSSTAFLEALSPRIAVISVGENRYGHPAEETLARLAAAGAATCTTLDCGAVTLATDGDEVTIQGYRGLNLSNP